MKVWLMCCRVVTRTGRSQPHALRNGVLFVRALPISGPRDEWRKFYSQRRAIVFEHRPCDATCYSVRRAQRRQRAVRSQNKLVTKCRPGLIFERAVFNGAADQHRVSKLDAELPLVAVRRVRQSNPFAFFHPGRREADAAPRLCIPYSVRRPQPRVPADTAESHNTQRGPVMIKNKLGIATQVGEHLHSSGVGHRAGKLRIGGEGIAADLDWRRLFRNLRMAREISFRQMQHDGAVVIPVVAGLLIADALGRVEMIFCDEVRTVPWAVSTPPSRDTVEAEHCRPPVLAGQLPGAALQRPFSHYFKSELVKNVVEDVVVCATVGRALARWVL